MKAKGFTLLEVLIAMAVLAFALTVITAGTSSSAVYSKRVYRSTVAALLLRGTMLDIEEKYRKDGFPTNDVTGKSCDLPKAYARQFKCNYDLIGLNLDDGSISDMTTQAQTVLGQAQETLAASGAMEKLAAGAPPAGTQDKKLKDLGSAGQDAKQADLDMSQLAKGGDLMGLLGMIVMSGDQGLYLLDMCDINLAVLQMSMGIMVAELLPRILKRASDRTRKVVLHLSWKDDEGEKRALEIESFTTAVSQEEAMAIQQMKQMDKVSNAIQGAMPPPGSPPGTKPPGVL